MKNLICSIAVVLSLIILGCDDDSIVNPIDTELQKNIVGIWKDNAVIQLHIYLMVLF